MSSPSMRTDRTELVLPRWPSQDTVETRRSNSSNRSSRRSPSRGGVSVKNFLISLQKIDKSEQGAESEHFEEKGAPHPFASPFAPPPPLTLPDQRRRGQNMIVSL
mmetsp:Transcript_58762/g.110077  ORF Transcript_58762/g.110077 Transcript_58762/m.110077 type:complete len:105 (-) Transcript_58762:73-387(-)